MSTDVKVPETLEEAQALLATEREAKDKALERAIWAEKVIENRKKDKQTPTDDKGGTFSKEDVEQMLAERDQKSTEDAFFAKNPDLLEHKEKLTAYTSKWISIEDAKALLEMKDETIANRKNISKANFTSGDSGVQAKTITQEELSKLPIDEFKHVMGLKDKGEVKII